MKKPHARKLGLGFAIVIVLLTVHIVYPDADEWPEFQAEMSEEDYLTGYEKVSNILQDPNINYFTKDYICRDMSSVLFFRLTQESMKGYMDTCLREKRDGSMFKMLKWTWGDFTYPYLVQLSNASPENMLDNPVHILQHSRAVWRMSFFNNSETTDMLLKFLSRDDAFVPYIPSNELLLTHEATCELYLYGLSKRVDTDQKLFGKVCDIVNKNVRERIDGKRPLTIRQRQVLFSVALALNNSRIGVKYIVDLDIQNGEKWGRGWMGLQLYKSSVILEELCKISLETKDEKTREFALSYLEALVKESPLDKSSKGWGKWLDINKGKIFRKGVYLLSYREGYTFNKEILEKDREGKLKSRFEVIDLGTYVKNLDDADASVREGAREKLIELFPRANEILKGKDVSSEPISKPLQIQIEKMIGRDDLLWDGMKFQTADLQYLKSLIDMLEINEENLKRRKEIEEAQQKGAHSMEEALRIGQMSERNVEEAPEQKKARDRLRALTRLPFVTPYLITKTRLEEAWFIANMDFIYWDSEQLFYRVDEDAKSACVRVIKWRLIPEDKRKNWKELSDKERLQLLDEAAAKLPEVIVPTKPPQDAGE